MDKRSMFIVYYLTETLWRIVREVTLTSQQYMER